MIHQIDVKTAFLNGDLEEEICMDQPEGFVLPGNEHKVCKLLKSLYGLKQTPRQWHIKFDQCLLSNGFKTNESDKCIYYKSFDDAHIIICLYVDDLLIFGSNVDVINTTKTRLKNNFDMKDLGEANVILGMRGILLNYLIFKTILQKNTVLKLMREIAFRETCLL